MSDIVPDVVEEESSSWLYEGIWGFLTQIFCVPRAAPWLPSQDGEAIVSRKPSAAFLTYLKFQFELILVIVGGVLIVGSLILAAVENSWFLLATIVVAMLLAVVAMVGYLTIHLRYDTMWYVFTDRSMRLRRGIWLIRESTITFENIQNVKVTQGPLQRFFGIADVVVETAGGGGAQTPHGGMSMHAGIIEGISDAAAIRDAILQRAKCVNSAGLGDEASPPLGSSKTWTPQHLAVLREIRDLCEALRPRATKADHCQATLGCL